MAYRMTGPQPLSEPITEFIYIYIYIYIYMDVQIHQRSVCIIFDTWPR